ncbi:F0F1 ATP synthase subunit delta [Solemya pervernicosa gill symbiont]|uniref:ATP synthase subunit delta n=2 Tax=Gammaproteobacteria incertae sedis TaxID=118884 RepID=A0A1T2L2S9_9GAMM|nr:F0F1 ATP synthase subunit delta [Candidatus Reidiella endopervernicosa]OOZ39382.1 F0F1 ATP synthase subunit delta [Solemya pervernicosa gill symbiont]QKQ25326.1 F0F1 ATP synthase subunit delta [Candidatus Reidiella endopervernicosa]
MAENITIARPYAQAIFALAQEQDNLNGWSEMLQLASAVAADTDMAALIDSPQLDATELGKLFLDICGDQLNEFGQNMVHVLLENDRLKLLPEIAALFEIERATAEGTVEAEVISAKEMTDAQKQGITESLKKRLGREVTLDCRIDETLLGGAIIRAGDVVIDGSVVGKLEKLAANLTN